MACCRLTWNSSRKRPWGVFSPLFLKLVTLVSRSSTDVTDDRGKKLTPRRKLVFPSCLDNVSKEEGVDPRKDAWFDVAINDRGHFSIGAALDLFRIMRTLAFGFSSPPFANSPICKSLARTTLQTTLSAFKTIHKIWSSNHKHLHSVLRTQTSSKDNFYFQSQTVIFFLLFQEVCIFEPHCKLLYSKRFTKSHSRTTICNLSFELKPHQKTTSFSNHKL